MSSTFGGLLYANPSDQESIPDEVFRKTDTPYSPSDPLEESHWSPHEEPVEDKHGKSKSFYFKGIKNSNK